MLTNKDVKIFFKDETNYGGGDAGAEFSETGPTAVNALTRVNFLAGNVKLKVKTFKRKRLKAPGIGLGKGILITTGADFPELEFSYYLQTLADPFKALAVGGTEGAAGTSQIFQIVIPDPDESVTTLIFNIFGAQLTSYSVKGGISDDIPPMVTVKFSCYSMVISGGGTEIQTGTIPTGIINEWDDIIVTLDADPILELVSFALTILNKFTESKSGRNSSFAKFKPLMVDKELTYEVVLYKDAAALMLDTITEALNHFTSVWTEGTNTITVTECYVESDNLGDLRGDDISEVEHTLTIKNGGTLAVGGSVFT